VHRCFTYLQELSFGRSGEISFASVPIRRNLASLPEGRQDKDLDVAPVFPERFKLGLASVGPFS